MVESATDFEYLERWLAQLVLNICERSSDSLWQDAEDTLRTLANGLRIRDGLVDNHTVLGKTALPQSLTTIFTLALHGASIPKPAFASVMFEILRVAANLCMDHDENRGHLLEAGLPQAIVSLLEGYAESLPQPTHSQPLTLSVPDLKVIKTAIGVLLNASIGFEPVKYRLISLEAAMTILKLSTAIYPPGSWVNTLLKDNDDSDGISSEEFWVLRSSLSNWAWRTISELKDVKDETLQIFTTDVLPLLTPPLLAFTPQDTLQLSSLSEGHSSITNLLLHADFEVLEESCMLIESLSLDIEDIRLSLARGLYFPAEHGGVPCLSTILDFIEHGSYPSLWNTPAFGEGERNRKEKAFDICKAALIKSVVEVAGEESNEDVLWDDSEREKPGGEFVCKMVGWIKNYVANMDEDIVDGNSNARVAGNRDDLVICASLSLGNLARREKNSIALLSPPHSLASFLTSPSLLCPSADIKVKHGIVGLLKHLAQASTQSPVIDTALGKAGVVQRLADSGIWDEKSDAMTDIVQLSAIGVIKHMCNANVEHTFALVLPSNRSPSSPTILSQILALLKRSDSVPIRSEGTRVLVNVVKSLWSADPTTSPVAGQSPIDDEAVKKGAITEKQTRRATAMRAVLTPDCVSALSNLVGRSAKYPLLVNEGIIALSVLSTQCEGGPLVLRAIISPLGLEIPSSHFPEPSSASSGSDFGSSVVPPPPDRGRLPVPRHTLDMLVFVLRNVDNPVNFPVEIRVNVCSFLLQLGKHTSGEELVKVKETVRPVLEKLWETTQGAQSREGLLTRATMRVLDAWS